MPLQGAAVKRMVNKPLGSFHSVLIEVWLIYNIVLILGIQQSYSDVYLYSFPDSFPLEIISRCWITALFSKYLWFIYFKYSSLCLLTSCGSDGKESAHSSGDLDSVPGLGWSPGEGKGCPLQYSGLENSMNWGCKELDTAEQLSLFFFFPLSLYQELGL